MFLNNGCTHVDVLLHELSVHDDSDFVTLATFMLLLSLMYSSCVSFQAASLFELAPADQTFKWPLTVRLIAQAMQCNLGTLVRNRVVMV